MSVVLALVGALALAAVPLALGWERGLREAEVARAFGFAQPRRRFDPEKWAAQTGTGLTFSQILMGALVWAGGGLLLGLYLGGGGLPAALFFAAGGGLFYLGALDARREAYRMAQAEDMLAAVAHLQALLALGRPLLEALERAAEAAGPAGRPVLMDLVRRLRGTEEARWGEAVRAWSTHWETLVDDMLAAALLTAVEGRVQVGELLRRMQRVIGEEVLIVRRARAQAKGLEWQARLLALWPPVVLILLTLTAGPEGDLLTVWRERPLYLLPVLLGSLASYLLTWREIRTRLSVRATMGLIPGRAGEIPTDRFGNPL